MLPAQQPHKEGAALTLTQLEQLVMCGSFQLCILLKVVDNASQASLLETKQLPPRPAPSSSSCLSH
eukprot:5785414-Amphidinium_carterae.2